MLDGGEIDQEAVSEDLHIRQAWTDVVSETSCYGLDTLTLHGLSEQASSTSVHRQKHKIVSSTGSESDGDPGKMRQVGSIASLSIILYLI